MDLINSTDRGIEMTRTTLSVIIGAVTLLGMVATGTAWTVNTRQQIKNATPSLRTDSLEARVSHHDTVLVEVRGSIDSLRNNLMGLNCHSANYPSPFCDGVPRVMQAGTVRGR